MYITNYRNKQEVIILSALSKTIFGTLTIDGDKQTMNLIKDKWKKVTTSGDAIIEYSDSEGNYWDVDYNSEFPYSYDTLDKEFMGSVKPNLISQLDDLEIIETKINNVLIDVEDLEIRTNIKDVFSRKKRDLNKLAANCNITDAISSEDGDEVYENCATDEPEPTMLGSGVSGVIRG